MSTTPVYTSPFTGTVVTPTDVSYLALPLVQIKFSTGLLLSTVASLLLPVLLTALLLVMVLPLLYRKLIKERWAQTFFSATWARMNLLLQTLLADLALLYLLVLVSTSILLTILLLLVFGKT